MKKFISADFANITNARRAYRAAGISLTKPVVADLEAKVATHMLHCARKIGVFKVAEAGRYLEGGSAYNKHQVELQDFALRVGRAYDNRIQKLNQSEKAVAHLGPAHDVTDWNAYSKSYGRPANYKEAGVYLEGREIVIENSRGKVVQRIALPARAERARIRMAFKSDNVLIDGDLWGIVKRENVVERFGIRKCQVVKIGFAVLLERMAQPSDANKSRADRIKYWEHGKTLKECAAELDAKNAIALRKWAEVDARKLSEKNAKKVSRAAKLAVRLCKNLQITFADARAVGYCEAGIKGWAEKNGFDINKPARAADLLAADAPGSYSYNARRVVEYVARQCASQRLLERLSA